MRPSNLDELRASFTAQAPGFESGSYHLSSRDYLDYMTLKLEPRPTDDCLEVAAGTCICARALSPYVRHTLCLDATPAMLLAGREAAEREGVGNLSLITGLGEEMPFLDDSFDIVLSRLAFHHFTNPEPIFAEMARVLKPGGKLVLWDMAPQMVECREEIDRLEAMRDPAHVKMLDMDEMKALYDSNGLRLTLQDCQPIPVAFESWMALTRTPEGTRQKLRRILREDMNGGRVTGLSPYVRRGQVCFDQHWVLNIGTK